jgi:dipeptidyl aminopeptidase/acylaminoacyl peptidase
MFSAAASPALLAELATVFADFHPHGFRLMARSLAETDTRGFLPGITVHGTIDGSAVLTDSLGIATSRTWTLGSVQGIQQVKAEIGGGAQNVFTAFACHETCAQQLLFVRDGEIVATDLLSGEEKPLAAGYEPAWSPDGRQIAFVRYDERGKTERCDPCYQAARSIYLMDADGSNVVLRAAGFHSPAWSPDGRSLAVARGECGPECEVYVLSATDDGTPPVRLADRADDPAWSPDGTKIAFVSRLREGDDGDALHVMNADGSEVRVIVPPESQPLQPNIDVDYMTHPTWSPDGRRIAFMKYSDPESYNLFVVNSDGSGLVRLETQSDRYYGAPFDPAWSPDGTMIAFTLRVYNEGSDSVPIKSFVAYVPADHGGEPIRIAPGLSPAWRPIVGNRE